METSQSKSFECAFVVGPADIERLLAFFNGNRAAISVRLSDGTKYSHATIDDFSRLTNAGSRRVKSVEVEIRNESLWATVEVVERNFGNIRFYASGPEKDVLWAASRIEEWVSSVRPWYSWISLLDFISFLLGSFFAAFVVLFVLATIWVWQHGLNRVISDEPETGRSLLIRAGINWAWLPLIAVGTLLNLARSRAFPVAIFDVGGGEQRRRSAERWRAAFGISFVASVAASIVAAFATSAF